jgi:hypothetical protein
MRREALPIRNELKQLAMGQNDVNNREQKIVTLQRQQDREECRRLHRLKEQKAGRKQSSAKAKKKKKQGGGVRASMEKGKTIARNRENWANICIYKDKKAQQDEQEGT